MIAFFKKENVYLTYSNRLCLREETLELSKPEIIALLLYAPGKTKHIGETVVGKTRLMKMLFLLWKETKLDELIKKASFKPYKYGPFDAEVYDAIEALQELRIVEQNKEFEDVEKVEFDGDSYDVDTTFQLTPLGIAKVKRIVDELPADVMRTIINYKTIYNQKPLVEILHYVYSKYPEYAGLSEAKI